MSETEAIRVSVASRINVYSLIQTADINNRNGDIRMNEQFIGKLHWPAINFWRCSCSQNPRFCRSLNLTLLSTVVI